MARTLVSMEGGETKAARPVRAPPQASRQKSDYRCQKGGSAKVYSEKDRDAHFARHAAFSLRQQHMRISPHASRFLVQRRPAGTPSQAPIGFRSHHRWELRSRPPTPSGGYGKYNIAQLNDALAVSREVLWAKPSAHSDGPALFKSTSETTSPRRLHISLPTLVWATSRRTVTARS